MQATVSYTLTEQAQRAQMAATGQPVARKQTMTIEITPDDLPLCNVAEDGTLSVDPHHSNAGPLVCAGWYDSNPIQANVYGPDILADIRAGKQIIDAAKAALIETANAYVLATESERKESLSDVVKVPATPEIKAMLPALRYAEHITDTQAYSSAVGVYVSDLRPEVQAVLSARYDAHQEAKRAASSAAIDAWIANPDLRLSPRYDGADITIGDLTGVYTPETRVKIEHRYRDLYAEIVRRNKLDEAAKAARDKAVEDAKTVAIEEFVATCGESIRQQYDDGLLCRKTIVTMLADAALATLPSSCPDSVVCRDSDCPCGDGEVECIPPHVYEAWKRLTVPEGTKVEFHCVRNCRGLEDYEECEERADRMEYHAILTVPHGPFSFTRRIKL